MTAGVATPAETEAWDAPPRRDADPDAAPVLAVDGFEGPLDWLLEMARARKVDLAELSILELVTAFEMALLAAIDAARSTEPDRAASALTIARWGDWLVMAAELTLLRSRLLAVSTDELKAAAQQAEALRRRLLDRAMVAASADWLDKRLQLGRDVFGRGLTADGHRAGRAGDVVGLLRACLAALALPDEAGEPFRVPAAPFWSVAQAMARIRQLLPDLGVDGGALPMFLPVVPADAPERERRCRAAVAGTLMAGLELAREGAIMLRQDRWSEPIVISPAEGGGNPTLAENMLRPARE